MNTVSMGSVTIKFPTLAIVQFGPATATSGFRAGEYYQVTIDPYMASPDGRFIRFGFYAADEIVGWQRIEAMTVSELLGPTDKQFTGEKVDRSQPEEVTMRILEA